MENEKYLPVRKIKPDKNFLHKSEGGGGGLKWFISEEEYEPHKAFLVSALEQMHRKFSQKYEEYPQTPIVMKALLREVAIAKSYRPIDLFNSDTCPIVGVENFGELLISTTKKGMEKLENRMKQPTSKKQRANITAIQEIKEYDENDKLLGLNTAELKERALKAEEICLKVTFFDYQDPEINKRNKNEFQKWVEERNFKIQNIPVLEKLNIWRVFVTSEKQIKEICKHPYVKTISYFPKFNVIQTKESILEKSQKDYPTPAHNCDYAKVGIIDSGISENHPFLSPWVIDRKSFVPKEYQDNFHGSFVAGLACMGSCLNGTETCPDTEQLQLIDLQVLPDNRKDSITEDDLVERLEEAIPLLTAKHGIKIWNMSLGLNKCSEESKFSSLGTYLDYLQDQNDIIITLPSGNYPNGDRIWNAPTSCIAEDKLQVPGDSVRAVTVGAIACKEKPDSIVRKNHPTSYSCRGPGPAYIIKPELAHYSGNLTLVGPEILSCSGQGIASFDNEGNIVEGIGTSYSCPLVARTLSLLYQELKPEVSINLVKALAIHNSYIPLESVKPEEIFPYVGFGIPPKVDEILNCDKATITLIFEQEIYEGHILEYPFVWPESLKNDQGKCFGNVKMTLVSGSPLDSSYGSEYIRVNLRASLQSKKTKSDGEETWETKLEETPGLPKAQYEKTLIENGFKWKPIKKYEKNFSRGIEAAEWRIRVYIQLRDGTKLGRKPVKFALVFTLSDPEGKASVYDEVVLGLRNINVISSPVQISTKVRQKI